MLTIIYVGFSPGQHSRHFSQTNIQYFSGLSQGKRSLTLQLNGEYLIYRLVIGRTEKLRHLFRYTDRYLHMSTSSTLKYSISRKAQRDPTLSDLAGPQDIQAEVCLVLGDNIFYGHGLQEIMKAAAGPFQGGLVFGYWVSDPERYGVVEFDASGRVISIEEKPKIPKSHYAVPGLYFFDNEVIAIASGLKPSGRGELEIADVINCYLKKGLLRVELLGRGFAWLDTGTHDSLLDAANFIQTLEKRQGLKVACVEEIAFRMGYIDAAQVRRLAEPLMKNSYGRYLLKMLDDRVM